jgi:hypothetical protein
LSRRTALAQRPRAGDAATVLAAAWALGSAWLTVLMLAAARGRRGRDERQASHDGLRLLVLVPAHDEQAVLGATLTSVARADYARSGLDVVVIADNCQDRTAEIASAFEVRVLVRTDPAHRGKGHALAWALRELRDDVAGADAVVFLDADCQVSANTFTALAARIAEGASAAQVGYTVANPGDSWSAALRWAAFALLHLVRPLGRDALGLSAGILGTGFALTPDLLERCPWRSFGLAEDGDYHLRLVACGERVAFAPEAAVTSRMPASLADAEQQHLRWEGGRWQIVRTWTPRLLLAGVREHSPAKIVAAVEPAIPPQSLLAAGNTAALVLGAARHRRGLLTAGLAGTACQAAYVVGGQVVARAPATVWRALAFSPALVAWKLALSARIVSGRGPQGWVGTRDRRRGRP